MAKLSLLVCVRGPRYLCTKISSHLGILCQIAKITPSGSYGAWEAKLVTERLLWGFRTR